MEFLCRVAPLRERELKLGVIIGAIAGLAVAPLRERELKLNDSRSSFDGVCRSLTGA